MTIKLYKMDLSPPARAVMMACEIFNVPVEMIELNLRAKEQLKPEFLKKNPLHTIPVVEDGDLVIHDSHAILMYLADTYAKDDFWYPKDIKKRTLVNQKLFFDTGILFPRLRNIVYSCIYEGSKAITEKQRNDVYEAYGFLEAFLSRSKYLAGDNLTIADISAITYVTSFAYILPVDAIKYPKTQVWIEQLGKLPYCQKYNAPGTKILGDSIIKMYES